MENGHSLRAETLLVADPPWKKGPEDKPEIPEFVYCGKCYANGVQYDRRLRGFVPCDRCGGERVLEAAGCEEIAFDEGEWYGF